VRCPPPLLGGPPVRESLGAPRESPLVDDDALSERGARTCSSGRPRPLPVLAARDPLPVLDAPGLPVDGRLDEGRADPDVGRADPDEGRADPDVGRDVLDCDLEPDDAGRSEAAADPPGREDDPPPGRDGGRELPVGDFDLEPPSEDAEPEERDGDDADLPLEGGFPLDGDDPPLERGLPVPDEGGRDPLFWPAPPSEPPLPPERLAPPEDPRDPPVDELRGDPPPDCVSLIDHPSRPGQPTEVCTPAAPLRRSTICPKPFNELSPQCATASRPPTT
jgi:hypothetical protein